MFFHFRRAAPLSAAAITILVLSGCGTAATSTPGTGTSTGTGTGTASTSGSPPASTPPASTPSATQVPATPGTSGTPAPATGIPAGYLPLFPFASLADVRAWQASYESGGHQPWHLSPDTTATAFAAYLGYTEVTEVTRSRVSGGDAHVAVGIKLPNGSTGTAAVIHLVRFGSGKYAPWEVVGTDDTTFTLDRPAYGSTVPPSVTVGGTITGVDESIRVTVHTWSAQGPVGSYCCQPAGGTSSPWTARVTFHAASGQVITIAASTGGHVTTVERFAVTGVRASLGGRPSDGADDRTGESFPAVIDARPPDEVIALAAQGAALPTVRPALKLPRESGDIPGHGWRRLSWPATVQHSAASSVAAQMQDFCPRPGDHLL